LRQSEKLKSALLDAVTHDLRTPLTSIKASITTLLDEVRGGELPATLDRDSRVEMMEVIDEESARRAGDELIEMAVEDDGPGIPKDLRERVFDKFFRATRDGYVTTRQPSGTGMGLAIAKGIVEAHEGRIWTSRAKVAEARASCLRCRLATKISKRGFLRPRGVIVTSIPYHLEH
jgi:K+-sensing histidine kinase KdpD